MTALLVAVLALPLVVLECLVAAQAPASVPPFDFIGCANETPGRTLLGKSFSTPNMTVPQCTDFCSTNDFKYAAVEYGVECFCGNVFLNNATVGFDNCGMACAGAPDETCGGSLRLSVYEDKTYTPDAIVPAVGTFQSLGCFSEGQTERVISALVTVSKNLTVPACVGVCQDAGYRFAGVEYEDECYCGNVLSNQTAPAPDADCNMKCAGDPTLKTFCGGSDRIILYQDVASNPPKPRSVRYRRTAYTIPSVARLR